MGRVKEFAFWLADCVYLRHMSNEAIAESVNLVNLKGQQDDFNRWLREQIQIVRKNPQLYEPSDDTNSSTCGRNSEDEEHLDE